jgi:hypothetical protein
MDALCSPPPLFQQNENTRPIPANEKRKGSGFLVGATMCCADVFYAAQPDSAGHAFVVAAGTIYVFGRSND